MNDFEKTIRTYFNLSMKGPLCNKCLTKHTIKYEIDALLKMNATTQANLGTDSSPEEREEALSVARYIKAAIIKIAPAKAESMFPEINLLE
jgi:hypothetical protein|tara:strand:+ start:128 stop:400 length:273 start_codon:yes stop_codon:yes gene_type:complete